MQTGYEIGKIYANSDGDGFIVWDEDKMSRLISYSMLFVDVLDCITAEVDDMSNEAREAYHQEYPQGKLSTRKVNNENKSGQQWPPTLRILKWNYTRDSRN